MSRESLERLSFIQKPPRVFHSNSLHFPFNFLSLCLLLSLLSSRSHAELQLQGHDCRLASRLISLFILLSHSWLTNTKREDALPVFKCSKLKKSQRNRRTENQFIFPVSCVCRSSTGFSTGAKSLTWSTQRKRNVPFRKHVTPFVQFPCLRCSPLRSAFLNTQFTQVAIAQWKRKKPQPCLHVARNTIIIGVHVGEHGV